MKRFFYTTAAVVAFAFSGMANTIELKEFESTEVYQMSTEEMTPDCFEQGAIVMDAILANPPKNINDRDLWNLAVRWGNIAIAFCMGYTWEDITDK